MLWFLIGLVGVVLAMVAVVWGPDQEPSCGCAGCEMAKDNDAPQ